jgi:VWFA-related protein
MALVFAGAFACLLLALSRVAVAGHAPHDQVSREANGPAARIDVVVVDGRGMPIQGLRLSNFEVREDGAPRRLQAAEYRTYPRNSPHAVLPIATELEEERAAREPGVRVFAFYLDEFHVSPGASAARAADIVASFIDDKVHERDLAAVFRPLDPVGSVRFTRDRALLHGAIASFAGRRGEYAPRLPLEEQSVGVDPATVRAARQRIVTANLRELALRIGRMKADRAIVVYVSEGFPEDTAAADSRVFDLDSLVRASSRFHFPVYTYNPAAPGEHVGPDAERTRAIAMLQRIAVQTGGLYISSDDVIAGFARVAHDNEAYYSLTYQPQAADGASHPLEVRVSRRGAKVRTNAVYWAALPSDLKALASLPSAVALDSRRSLRRSRAVDTWIGVRRDAAGRTQMTITWEPRTGGDRSPRVAVVTVRDVLGTTLFDGRLAPVGADARDSARFAAPAGRVEVDLTVLDEGGDLLDTERRDFDVPDFGPSATPGPRLLTPEIVRTRTRQEFESACISPDAPPASVRSFVRTQRLLIRTPAFDVTGTSVRVTARLLNRIGLLIRDIEGIPSASAEGPAQFTLPLFGLPPDTYQIEVVGTNANGSATERATFRVVQ